MVRFGGSLESGDRVCVDTFGRNLVSVSVKMFSRLIYFIKKFYEFCTLNVISKDNVLASYFIVLVSLMASR